MTIKSFVCVAVLTVFMPLWASDADEGKEISIAVSTSPISPSLVLHTSSDGEEDSDLEAQRKTQKKETKTPKNL
jgi:type II secretory pathway component PulF